MITVSIFRSIRKVYLKFQPPPQMLHQTTLNFLKELKINNSKEWLEQNQSAYQGAKNDILDLTEKLIASLSQIDNTILKAVLDPKKCITRLNRDLRFAKFKIPYKSDYYIVLNKHGKNSVLPFIFYTLSQAIAL